MKIKTPVCKISLLEFNLTRKELAIKGVIKVMTFSGGLSGFFWSLFMIISMALPFILLLLGGLILGERLQQRKVRNSNQPVESLKIKLVKGEISVEDFARIKQQLN